GALGPHRGHVWRQDRRDGRRRHGVRRKARTIHDGRRCRENRLKLEEALLPPIVALLIALLVGDVLILSFGQSPAAVYRQLLEGTWGNAYGFGQVLYKATTLMFTGLSVALALRAGLFNIGAESQLAAGGFAAA